MPAPFTNQRSDHLASAQEDRLHHLHADVRGHALQPPPTEFGSVEEGPNDTMDATRSSREEFQRFRQWKDDSEKAERAVLAGEVMHVPMTAKQRFEILDENLSIRMAEIEAARERIIRLVRLLANPAEMRKQMENPESLHCQIAEQKARINEVRPEILRLTELVMDTLAGKFGCDYEGSEIGLNNRSIAY